MFDLAEAARGEYGGAIGEDGARMGISFAAQNRQKAVVRQERRACDVAVAGSEEYVDRSGRRHRCRNPGPARGDVCRSV